MASPPNAPPTVPAWKTSFLTSQTNILARPIAPSKTWRTTNQSSDQAIPDRVIDEALHDLNTKIQKHCRRTYPPQASRNVAEQINDLYVIAAERRVGDVDDVEGGIGRELDLTNHQVIQALPPTWESEKDTTNYPMEAKHYADTVQSLTTLSTQRQQSRNRIARLRKIRAALEPLNPLERVQENIVTRNGEMEKELEKMRMLLARVTGRVSMLPIKDTPERVEGLDARSLEGEGRKRKIDDFLGNGTVFPS